MKPEIKAAFKKAAQQHDAQLAAQKGQGAAKARS
jgi:hypothetical protein